MHLLDVVPVLKTIPQGKVSSGHTIPAATVLKKRVSRLALVEHW